ncbi:uncharacterized protein LOC143486058 isoform X2 [Brachyhypopomus gauderio]|uniref:uncharacterized protein LOC143486058 isoform X2 n=1 Tax=Brachyhypopomus gauderio TaxID=698409 RepID=UPI00404307BA
MPCGMKLIYVMTLTLIVFMETISENIIIVGPSAPLVVKAGEDLILPCSLQPNISAEDMRVEWYRPDLTQTNRLVHLYEDHEDRNKDQIKSYRGRTGLFKEELQKGNTSLKLSAVQPSDEGNYKCFIQSDSWYDDVTLWVTVEVNVNLLGPAVPLVAVAGEDLVLPCSVQPSISAEGMTVEWTRLYLKQTLVHLYEGYEDKNDDQIESYRGRTGLFKEELQKGNISLKLSAVQPSDEGVYKCLIKSPGWYDDITVYVEVKGNGFHAWKIAVICISVFGVVFIAFAAYIWKEKQLSPAQCSAVAYLRLQSQIVRSEWNLNKYNTSEEGYRRLIPAVTNCRKARLTGCNLTEICGKYFELALCAEKSALKELDLSNSNLQESAVEQLSAGLKSSHCKLEILRLPGCNLTVKSCEYLTSALQSENSSLKQLDLNNNNLLDAGVEQLSVGLKNPHCKLETLRLAGCHLTVDSCKYLKSTLQTENSPLKQLDLNNNNLQDSGVEELSAGLKSSHCKLETLRLALCNLGGKTCENLASILQMANALLRELDLSNNDLNNSGVEQLSTGLKSSNCKLETLRLSGCLVTEEGCSSLASALSSNLSHLKELDLTYNNPGESGVKLLSARLEDPHCRLDTLSVEHAGMTRMKPGLRKYACELTLDTNTAYTQLSLSEGNRKVTRVKLQQSYPDHPDRFCQSPQVLSRECVCGGSECGESVCGRCYWEAELSEGAAIAVTYKEISRKGRSDDCWFGLNVKSWCLYCSNNNYSFSHNKKETDISAPSSSNRIGVYVDWPIGTLSFYSVSSDTHKLTHLHTFHSTFTQPLYAGIGVWNYNSSVCVGENNI